MALDAQHPLFTEFHAEWLKLRHCYGGEAIVKAQGQLYLPPTPGHLIDGMGETPKGPERGKRNYDAYKLRARFPNYIKRSVREMVGVMHNKPSVIELPAQMEPLRKRATLAGESLPLLLRRVNAEQLLVGRIGLLLDMPKNEPGAALPYFAHYAAETMTNWDSGEPVPGVPSTLNLVILNETAPARQPDFTWNQLIRYRTLTLGDPLTNEITGVYQQGVFEETVEFNAAALFEPSLRGNKPNFIPFVFINAADLLPEPDTPPLLELADLALAIYRKSADYELNLFMQAQETLVEITNDSDEDEQDVRVGVGARLRIPVGGDAKYIGVSAAGLGEQRQAMENDRTEAGQLAGQLINTMSRQRESGEALQTRVSAQTATLKDIVLTGAEGLQAGLRQAALLLGADPEKVLVVPNLDFAEALLTPQDFVNIQSARKAGLPLDDESIHEQLLKAGWTTKSWTQMRAIVEEEHRRAIERQREMFAANPPSPNSNQPPEPFQRKP